MSIYNRLSATAERLLAQYKTGDTQRVTVTITPPVNEWEQSTVATEAAPFDAFVTGVPAKIADGERVLITDRVLLVAGDVPLTASDNITIDGRGVQVVQYQAIPAAGNPVLRRLIVRG